MTAKLRINIVLGPFFPIPPVRGLAVEKIQYGLARAYADKGHDVTMISRRFPGFANRETVDGISHVRVPSFDPPRPGLLYRLLDVIYSLLVSVYMPVADITVTNSVSAPLILPLRKAGKIAVAVGRYPKGQMRFYGRAARLHAVSRAVLDAIVEQAPRTASRALVIANPIGQQFAEAIAEPRGPRDREIVYVGRISGEKGLDLLLAAFKAIAPDFPDWRLRLIGPWSISHGGDGLPYLNELKAPATGLEGRIEFAGAIYEDAALIARLKKADIFVYPSLAEHGEAFGLAPLEAMACGCVPVLSALRCFEDFAEDGRNCSVFDHRRNAEANLAGSMARLMGDAALRERLGLAAMQSASRFAPQIIAEAMLADFQTLVRHDD